MADDTPRDLTSPYLLSHCGLVTPYGNIDLGQHWPRQWLHAWRHQAITCTNVDLSSVKSSDLHIRSISLEMHQPSITKIRLKITYLKLHSNFPGANGLKILPLTCIPRHRHEMLDATRYPCMRTISGCLQGARLHPVILYNRTLLEIVSLFPQNQRWITILYWNNPRLSEKCIS